MEIDTSFISIPFYILRMATDAKYFYAVLLARSYTEKVSYNEMFEILSGEYEAYFKNRRYTDIRSLRRAALSNNMLPIASKPVPILASKLIPMAENDKIFLDPEIPGGIMTQELMIKLGLSELWEEYEEDLRRPPIILTAEQVKKIKELGFQAVVDELNL
jgi:hypothetical protein